AAQYPVNIVLFWTTYAALVPCVLFLTEKYRLDLQSSPRKRTNTTRTSFILRESSCTHFEKPFLYLIFGSDRALLEDTGAGQVDTSTVVMGVIVQWAKRNNKDSVPLIVMHSHAHGDHVAGDGQFKDKPNIQF